MNLKNKLDNQVQVDNSMNLSKLTMVFVASGFKVELELQAHLTMLYLS